MIQRRSIPSLYLSHFCSLLSTIMDCLTAHGINTDLNAAEFEHCFIRTLSTDAISNVRNALFVGAKEANLVSLGDALVQRRKTNGGKSVMQKHASDIWQLVCSIKSKTSVPRTLLKNGKRSKAELCASQARCAGSDEPGDYNLSGTASSNSDDDTTASTERNPDSSSTQDTAFRSTVVNDIGSLKSTVDLLKQDIQV